MARRGRPRASTEAQREQVRRNAAEGQSRRQIAEDVFGDARYRGRVDRILRSTSRRSDISPALDDTNVVADHPTLATVPDESSLRELVDRYRQSLAARDGAASLSELQQLLRIERQLAAMEQLERLNALTRDRVALD